MNDTIYRQAAIDALKAIAVPRYLDAACEDIWARDRTLDNAIDVIHALPSAQPEPSIPLSWIDKYIEWLQSLDNEFANLAGAHTSVMVKKWRDEQNETD